MSPMQRLPTFLRLSLTTSTTRTFTSASISRCPVDESKKEEHTERQKDVKADTMSGENVKADRENVSDHNNHMKELQEEGKKKGEKGHL